MASLVYKVTVTPPGGSATVIYYSWSEELRALSFARADAEYKWWNYSDGDCYLSYMRPYSAYNDTMVGVYSQWVAGDGQVNGHDTIAYGRSLGFNVFSKASGIAAGTTFDLGGGRVLTASSVTTAAYGATITWAFVLNGVSQFTISCNYYNSCLYPLLPLAVHLYPTIKGSYGNTLTAAASVYLEYNSYYSGTNVTFGTVNNGNTLTSAQYTNIKNFLDGVPVVDTDDPYMDIDDSEPSGPAEGSGIPESDPVDIPGLPTVSVTDTGFVGLFNPNLAQVQNLADYMWTGLFDINTYKKIFADPMDCILGFNMVPVDVPAGSVPVPVRVGNISTGILMYVATSQWVEVDCGSITLELPYGCYLDYAPYSKFSLYLPYIGIVELSTDDVVGKTLTLKYHVDVLSCSCVAFLKCGDSVLYQFTGSCGYSIPLTGDSFKQTVANVVSIAATVGGVVASGGISAPAAVAAGASVTSNVMNSKPEIHRSGAIGSSAGLLGLQKPYLIMELPNACKPAKQYHYLGYPGFITVKISNLSGFASFESVILDGIGCTSEERQMIESYCSGGIYV